MKSSGNMDMAELKSFFILMLTRCYEFIVRSTVPILIYGIDTPSLQTWGHYQARFARKHRD